MIRMKALFLAILTLGLFLKGPSEARAATFGDAALTVSIATVSGAVLGLSTLPFYEESGKHTKNIFYGAAIGAVAGVLISAYSGVKEGPGDDEEEEAFRLDPKSSKRKASLLAASEKQNRFSLTENSDKKNAVLVWAPVLKFNF